MLRLLTLAAIAVLPVPAAAQTLGTLKVTIVLADADGSPAPAPRYPLLVSDNPATAEPRRLITGLDGRAQASLRPGNYTVESDRPLAFRGRRYEWLMTVDIAAGRDTVLELTAANAQEADADTSAATPEPGPESDSGFLFHQWQGSVVAIWTPATHASGFLVDAKGLVVTNQRGIGAASTAEVQLTPTVKVAARVLAIDAGRDVAILWINPTVVAAVPPVPLVCTPPSNPPEVGAPLLTIGVPLRGEKDLTTGAVVGLKPDELATDLLLPAGSAGGPVFAAGGAVVGLTSLVAGPAELRQRDARVVRIENACAVLASAQKAMAGTEPPSATLLPVEPSRPFPIDVLTAALERPPGSVVPYRLSSADFDITLLTPTVVYAELNASTANRRTTSKQTRDPKADLSFLRPRMEFGAWSDYVADVRPVLLVRITPRFAEGFWAKVGRVAAETQGLALPPRKKYKSGFLRLRALCGTSEVTPIHPFELETNVTETASIDEGLYVFDPGALGPHCGTVSFELYSAAAAGKADTRVVDPKVVEGIWQDFAPFREAKE
jgi:S1-C subfamily serine protease